MTAVGWTAFAKIFISTYVCLVACLAGFVVVMNPFGNLPLNLTGPHVIMDINQRFQFPSVIRSGKFDSIVIGTSTSRLLNPALLEKKFGGHFANLAMNDGRAWEQAQLMKLFVKTNGAPRTLLIGLDGVWCDLDAWAKRISRRGFPKWMYDDNPINDWAYILNGKAVEISVRKIGHYFGLYGPRIPQNGFKIFTPPENRYDAKKAFAKIWGGRDPSRVKPIVPAVQIAANEARALKFQALDWLEESLARLPERTRKLLVFTPQHIAAQPIPGSREAAIEKVCKSRIADIARRYGALAIDMRISSPITRKETNYWDSLHYRVPVGVRVVDAVAAAWRGTASDGTWRVLNFPGTGLARK